MHFNDSNLLNGSFEDFCSIKSYLMLLFLILLGPSGSQIAIMGFLCLNFSCIRSNSLFTTNQLYTCKVWLYPFRSFSSTQNRVTFFSLWACRFQRWQTLISSSQFLEPTALSETLPQKRGGRWETSENWWTFSFQKQLWRFHNSYSSLYVLIRTLSVR